MKLLKGLKLADNEKEALNELKEKVTKKLPSVEIILYGSKARGDFDRESDIDLLILVDSLPDSKLEEELTEISYDIELKYDVIFGKIIENKDFWQSPLAKAMPFHWNIDREGISV